MDINLVLQLWNDLGTVGKVIAVLLALHPVASAIAAATPTPVDDGVYAKFYRFILQPLALNIGKAFDKGE